MTNPVQDAFRRAAQRGGPLFQRYDVFVWADAERQKEPRLNWLFSAPGAQRWFDVDDGGNSGIEDLPNAHTLDRVRQRTLWQERGAGIITLFTNWDSLQKPDYIRDHEGTFYSVKALLGRDALAASVRFEVRKRYGRSPEIAYDAP